MCKLKCGRQELKYAIIITGYIILIISAFIVAFFIFYWLNSNGYLTKFLEWIMKIGYWGNLILGICLMITNLPLVMGYATLLIAAGFLYGLVKGLITVFVSCQLVIFLIAIFIRIPKFRIPTQNLTSISLWQFQLSSFLGMAPKQIGFVYLGTTLYELAEVITGSKEFSWRQGSFMIIGISGLIILIIFLIYITNKVYRQVQMNSNIVYENEMEKYSDMNNYNNNNNNYRVGEEEEKIYLVDKNNLFTSENTPLLLKS